MSPRPPSQCGERGCAHAHRVGAARGETRHATGGRGGRAPHASIKPVQLSGCCGALRARHSNATLVSQHARRAAVPRVPARCCPHQTTQQSTPPVIMTHARASTCSLARSTATILADAAQTLVLSSNSCAAAKRCVTLLMKSSVGRADRLRAELESAATPADAPDAPAPPPEADTERAAIPARTPTWSSSAPKRP